MWGFPEIGVPLSHPFIDGFSYRKLSIWGIPHLWKPPMWKTHGFPTGKGPQDSVQLPSAWLNSMVYGR